MADSNIKNFYRDFHESNPALILGLMIISFGLYLVNWIYLRNREFEALDDLAPDANRGAIILMILPFIWFFFIQILKKLFSLDSNLFVSIMEILGWGFITFLVLKYFLDFSLSYGRITQTNGIIWFFGFLLGIVGIYAVAFKWYYLSFLLIFFFLIIPAMQAELNVHYKRITIKKERSIFYH